MKGASLHPKQHAALPGWKNPGGIGKSCKGCSRGLLSSEMCTGLSMKQPRPKVNQKPQMLPESVAFVGILICVITCLLASWLLRKKRKLLYFRGWEYPANRGMVLAGMWLDAVIRNYAVLVRFVPKLDILGPTQREMKPPEPLLLFGGKSFIFWCHRVPGAC